jgi:GNAT superfamily N-acetyltransferase
MLNQRAKNAMQQVQGNSVELRHLDDSSRLEVAQFFHDVWHETQAPIQPPEKAKYRDVAFFLARVNGRANTIAAYNGEQLAGFVSWTDNRLDSLFVHRKYRGHGVGLKLMHHAETAMFEAGHSELVLDCVYGNDAAKRFYERHEGIIFTKLWMLMKSRGS